MAVRAIRSRSRSRSRRNAMRCDAMRCEAGLTSPPRFGPRHQSERAVGLGNRIQDQASPSPLLTDPCRSSCRASVRDRTAGCRGPVYERREHEIPASPQNEKDGRNLTRGWAINDILHPVSCNPGGCFSRSLSSDSGRHSTSTFERPPPPPAGRHG